MEEIVKQHFPEFEGFCWERLCRQAVSGQVVGGEMFNVASRWWGNVDKSERIEIDVVAESMDKKTLLVGECKWTNGELFLKERPRDKTDGIVFLPEDVLKII